MTTTQTKIQQNAALGASLTETALLKSFWVLKRSVDINGADFLVQQRENHEDRTLDGPMTFGLVQAKFFEGNNQVKIARSYVEYEGNVRPDFFAFLHTLDVQKKESSYFFTASQILSRWNITEDKSSYYFSLTLERDFTDHKNLTSDEIEKLITDSLSNTSSLQNRFVLQNFFNLHVDTRSTSQGSITYMLRTVEGCKVVIYKSQKTGSVRPLEPRRDLFPYAGDFSWGYPGTGPQFLSVSILGHHLGGSRLPSNDEIQLLTSNIIDMVKNQKYELSSEKIDELLKIIQVVPV